MIFSRNGCAPRIDPSAKVAESAQIIGNVTIGEYTLTDHNVVIESSGPLINIANHVAVFANSVIRSIGGTARAAFPGRDSGSYVGGAVMCSHWLPYWTSLLRDNLRHHSSRSAY